MDEDRDEDTLYFQFVCHKLREHFQILIGHLNNTSPTKDKFTVYGDLEGFLAYLTRKKTAPTDGLLPHGSRIGPPPAASAPRPGNKEEILDLAHRYVNAARIMVDIQQDIRSTFSFTCSLGVGFSKDLAKLASSLHKPDRLALVFPQAVPRFLGGLSLSKLRGYGGKLGEHLGEKLGNPTVGELLRRPLSSFAGMDHNIAALLDSCHGLVPGGGGGVVQPRAKQSLSSSKQFQKPLHLWEPAFLRGEI